MTGVSIDASGPTRSRGRSRWRGPPARKDGGTKFAYRNGAPADAKFGHRPAYSAAAPAPFIATGDESLTIALGCVS
jgi:hypothetical protein